MRWVVAILSIFSGTAVVGQNLKGSKSIGAAVSVSYQNDQEYFKTWRAMVNPLVAHYYSDVSAVGVGVFYQYSHTRFDIDNISSLQTSHDVSVYPFWRHHFVITEKTGAFIRVDAGFGYSRVGDYENDYHLSVGGRSGLYHFLADRWCMELVWGYASFGHTIRHTSDGNSTLNSFNINLAASSINVGVQYFFLKE